MLSPQPPHQRPFSRPLFRCAAVALTLVASCASSGGRVDEPAEAMAPPIPGAVLANELIQPGEVHFKNLWRLTFGGTNAEAYWSYGNDRLSLQIKDPASWECDRIFVTGADGSMRPISNGRGSTTCSFFMPGDEQVIYSSTQSTHVGCPEFERGPVYTWPIWPEHDVYVQDLSTGEERTLVGGYGYDAEATVSPVGDRIVFTSTRSGDLELWTCDLEGGDLQQVTTALGYDGGAFFSHDGTKLVFRANAWTPGKEEAEQEAYLAEYQQWRVKPNQMELFTINPDGSDRRQVTSLGLANFAPNFFPDDQRIIFSTNHHNEPGAPGFNFDLFACNLDGSGLEQITYFDDGPGKQFDSFPMFSRDGRYLAFSSSRGRRKPGDIDLFIAEWNPQAP